MLTRNMFPVPDFGLMRKTILSVLIGLMGGGVAVLAQTADAAAPATAPAVTAPAADVPPATSARRRGSGPNRFRSTRHRCNSGRCNACRHADPGGCNRRPRSKCRSRRQTG